MNLERDSLDGESEKEHGIILKMEQPQPPQFADKKEQESEVQQRRSKIALQDEVNEMIANRESVANPKASRMMGQIKIDKELDHDQDQRARNNEDQDNILPYMRPDGSSSGCSDNAGTPWPPRH